MKITLENTDQIVQVDGVAARIWSGHTESGVEIHVLITRIAVYKDADATELYRELREVPAPREAPVECFPLAMIL